MNTADHTALIALFHRRLARALVRAAGPEACSIPCVDRLARHAITSAYLDLVALGERRSADAVLERALRHGVRP